MIVIHAVFPIEPEEMDTALELTEEMIEQSNREEGVIDYRAAKDVGDENVLRFFEQYEDAEAFESHATSDHLQAFSSAFMPLLSGEPHIERFAVDSASEVEI